MSEALDGIREWVQAPFHDIGDAGPVLDRLLGALDAILALHKSEPLTFAQGANCSECEDQWPCRTVAAVNDALEAGK